VSTFLTYYTTECLPAEYGNRYCTPLLMPAYVLTNSTELSLSLQVESSSANQEFINILWNPKVDYRVYEGPPLVPILSQMNPVHTLHPISLLSILTLSSYMRLSLSSSLFPSGFPIKMLYAFLFSPCVLHVLSILPSLTWTLCLYLVKSTSHETPHCAIRSSFH
jgi:hypothetical protein